MVKKSRRNKYEKGIYSFWKSEKIRFIRRKKWDINTSSILTKLIQEAGRHCKNFASDLFVQWNAEIDSKLINGSLDSCNLIFAFRENGVDHKDFYEIRSAENYIYKSVWFLDISVANNEMKMTLHS